MTHPAKLYQLSFSQREGYLRAEVQAASIDRERALAYLGEIAKRCREPACRRVMLIRDIPMMLPDADLFFTTTDFLKMIGDTFVAFVNPHSDIAPEMDFAILIGKNRGGNYRLFNDERAAETWLLGMG